METDRCAPRCLRARVFMWSKNYGNFSKSANKQNQWRKECRTTQRICQQSAIWFFWYSLIDRRCWAPRQPQPCPTTTVLKRTASERRWAWTTLQIKWASIAVYLSATALATTTISISDTTQMGGRQCDVAWPVKFLIKMLLGMSLFVLCDCVTLLWVCSARVNVRDICATLFSLCQSFE